MSITELFQDQALVSKIQRKLPQFFELVRVGKTRGGGMAMDVGSDREPIIKSLLIHKFGRDNVITDIPAIEKETDVILCGKPISIKTSTNSFKTKLIWTTDRIQMQRFKESYLPKCDMIFVHIVTKGKEKGGLHYLPQELLIQTLNTVGRDEYIDIPPEDTNPRGIELRARVLKKMVSSPSVLSITINWNIPKSESDEPTIPPIEQWLKQWQED